jgi:hypothetical protein
MTAKIKRPTAAISPAILGFSAVSGCVFLLFDPLGLPGFLCLPIISLLLYLDYKPNQLFLECCIYCPNKNSKR